VTPPLPLTTGSVQQGSKQHGPPQQRPPVNQHVPAPRLRIPAPRQRVPAPRQLDRPRIGPARPLQCGVAVAPQPAPGLVVRSAGVAGSRLLGGVPAGPVFGRGSGSWHISGNPYSGEGFRGRGVQVPSMFGEAAPRIVSPPRIAAAVRDELRGTCGLGAWAEVASEVEALPLSLSLSYTSEPGPEPVHGPADLEVFRVLPSALLGALWWWVLLVGCRLWFSCPGWLHNN